MSNEKVLKHIVISDQETLTLFNKAKSKLLGNNVDVKNLTDKKVLHMLLVSYLGD